MAINLEDITIDPADRPGQFKDINRVNRSLAQSAQARGQAAVSANDFLNQIQQDVDTKKAVYQQETAQNLQELNTGINTELGVLSNQYLRQQALLNRQDQELAALKAQSESDQLPSSERRKAKKEYDQLNEEAFTTQQRVQNLAQSMQTMAISKETLTKNYLDSRQVNLQAQFDLESHKKAMEIEGKIESLNLAQEFENTSGAYVNQMRSLTESEARLDQQKDSGLARAMYFAQVRGDSEAMRNAGEKELRGAMEQFSQIPQDVRQDFANSLGAWTRMTQNGEEPNWSEFVGVLARQAKVGTIEAYADISGDEQLQEVIRAGVQPYKQGLITSLTQQFEEANARPPAGQELKNINAQADQAINDGYARDLLKASFGLSVKQASDTANAAGGQIFSAVGSEDLLDSNAYSPEIMEVFASQEFKNAISQVGSDSGNEVVSAADRMMEVFSQKGFTSNKQQMEAARAGADFIRQSSLKYLRSRDHQTMADLDYFGSLGFPADFGVLTVELPRTLSRQARSGGVEIKSSYDVTEGSDLYAAVEAVRAAKKYRQDLPGRARAAAPAGRTRAVGEALQSFDRNN